MEEKVFFANSKGIKLCGILSTSTKNKDKPLIILSHGFGSNKNSKTYVRLQEVFNRYNLSTLRYDFFGVGESEGDLEDITISEAVDDILSAIKFLKIKEYNKIGLFGSSFGGMASIIAASKTKDIFVLTLKSPVSNYFDKLNHQFSRDEVRTWKKNKYINYTTSDGRIHKLNYMFYEDSKNNDGYVAAQNIEVPTLIVHGDADKTVPIEQSKKIASIINNCKLEILQGTEHRYTRSEDFERMLDLISSFIIKVNKLTN